MTAMRFAVDTGGTFTDLVVDTGEGGLRLFKSPTTPDDPVRGVLDVLGVAAEAFGVSRDEMLARGELFIHATTRAINAILTGRTAKTAFLTTTGHPDVLVYREGGRTDPFNFTRGYPQPYIPRALTFEVEERIGSRGEVLRELDEEHLIGILPRLRELDVEAVAVCLLWSIVNPAHELRVGELLAEHLPGIPVTLSHELNPTLREYRRASSACIDASLKPVMSSYLGGLRRRLEEAGFGGRVLMVTSGGGMLDAAEVADAPIHSIGSGPAMAPVAGAHYARLDAKADVAIVADTGGTSYDVSLVRRGRIPWTRETWLGEPFLGHMTGFPSVDVTSIGAGGGSIAWVDDGGLLRVGPESAGSQPGPVCYGRGGTRPTVTDCCLVLGYVDPAFFLGGTMRLDAEAAREAVATHVAAQLGLGVEEAAAAVVTVATEHMVGAIEEITINQGIDPRSAILIAGGGAAGLNAVAIATRLGCPRVVIPETGAALSAAGALMSELVADYATTLMTDTRSFDHAAVREALRELREQCERFIAGPGSGAESSQIDYSVEARYPHQVWQLDVPLRSGELADDRAVEELRQDFHALHEEVFAICDRASAVELITWRARVRCRVQQAVAGGARAAGIGGGTSARQVYFPSTGATEARVERFEQMAAGVEIVGPAIVESPFTTVVVDPGATVCKLPSGSLTIVPANSGDAAGTAGLMSSVGTV